jgi:esterase
MWKLQPVGDLSAPASRTVWIVHGILGSARNWRSFARRLAEARPGWKVVPVDLRNHGDAPPRPGPHDLEACAADLAEIAATLGGPPAVLVGHSFGGKVVLAYAAHQPTGLEQVWVLDAVPWALSGGELRGEVAEVLSVVGSIPLPVLRREDVRDAFVGRGFTEAIADWMTTNLRRGPDGLRWSFDLAGVREMLVDYARVDLAAPSVSDDVVLHLVRGGRSDRWDDAALERLGTLGHSTPAWEQHLLPAAGHWVHAEDPEGLLLLLAEALRASERRDPRR